MGNNELKRGDLTALELDGHGTLGGLFKGEANPCFEMVGRDRENEALTAMLSASPDMFETIAAVCEEPIMWAEDKHFDGNGGYYALSKDKFDAMCAALSKAKGHNTSDGEG